MNRSMLGGILIGVAVAAAGAAVANFGLTRATTRYAEVLDVKPVRQTIRAPREECQDVAVERQRPAKDPKRIAGTAVGVVVGGALGSQVGHGNGAKLATVAGAAAGGYAGNRIQRHEQQTDTYAAIERRCRAVAEQQSEVIGYDVRYRIGDTVDVVRTSQQPGGKRIPLKDGRLLIEGGAAPDTLPPRG